MAAITGTLFASTCRTSESAMFSASVTSSPMQRNSLEILGYMYVYRPDSEQTPTAEKRKPLCRFPASLHMFASGCHSRYAAVRSARCGLQSQSRVPGSCVGSRSGSTEAFFQKVHSTVSARSCGGVGRHGEVTMMPIGTPRVPYRTPGEGGWQWVDIWNVLYRERIIFIGENIDEDFGNQVLATMLFLDSIDSNKPMWLYINGPGGDLTPCLALYDTMESIKSPVGSLAMGYAYNMAAFLLAAGTKGSRLAMPMARIALQSPAGSAGGTAMDLKNEADELLRVRNYIFEELAKKTGKKSEMIQKDLARIKRFSAEEALEYGIIDRILRPRRLKADASKEKTGRGLG